MSLLEALVAPAPLQLVMFDLDGTLVDSVPDLHASTNAMLADLGYPLVCEEQVRSWVGNGAAMLVKRALARDIEISRLQPDSEFDAAYARFIHHYTQFNGVHAQCYEGARDLLGSLRRRGIHTAIVTNKPEQFSYPLVEQLSLDTDLLVCGDTLPQRKPDPQPLHHCLHHFDLSARRALMVGDSISDIHAAHAAGIKIVAVSYGYNHGIPIETCAPDRIIDSLRELG